jgi:Ca2+/Na+ antiporter
VKAARWVWSRGKGGDYIKSLPIAIKVRVKELKIGMVAVNPNVRERSKGIMSVIFGSILFLIGIVVFISILVYGYKDFKEDDSKTSKKVFFLLLGIIDILFSMGGFGLLLSLCAILIGLYQMGLFH